MRLPMLFALALLTPVLLIATLLLPTYGTIYGATYIMYWPTDGSHHPLADKYLDVFHIFNTWEVLLDFWSSTPDLSFVNHTLPIVGLPMLGAALALFFTYRLTRRLINYFHLSASI